MDMFEVRTVFGIRTAAAAASNNLRRDLCVRLSNNPASLSRWHEHVCVYSMPGIIKKAEVNGTSIKRGGGMGNSRVLAYYLLNHESVSI